MGAALEPVLLGLLVAPSGGGVAVGLAALVAFLFRTPLKLALVDRRRGRALDRTRLATRVAAVEAVLLVVLAAVALALSGWTWLVPVAVAAPLVGLELWFDVRSRSRRLVPELAGAVGMGAVAAAIVVAGGGDGRLATAAWLVLAARAVGSIPFVRARVVQLHRGSASRRPSDRAQVGAVAVALAATAVERAVWPGAVVVGLVAVAQAVGVRRPPVPAKVLGLRQMAIGVTVVLATAVGTWIA